MGGPALPAGWQPDDLAVLAVWTNGSNAFSVSGWGAFGAATSNATLSSSLFYKRLVAGDTTPNISLTGTALSTSNGAFARIYVFRNVNEVSAINPIEGAAGTTPATGTAVTTSAVTTAGTQRLVISILMAEAATGWTSAPPASGWTEIGGVDSSTSGADAFSDAMAILVPAATTTAAASFGTLNASVGWRTVSFAVVPQYPPMSDFTDDFSDGVYTGDWTTTGMLSGTGSTVTETGGRLQVITGAQGTSTSGLEGLATYRFRDQSVTVALPTIPGGAWTTTGRIWLTILVSAGNTYDSVGYCPNDATIKRIHRVSGSGTEQSSAATGTPTHLRLREAAGTTYYEYSIDGGATWVTAGSSASQTPVGVKLRLSVEQVNSKTVEFDDLNAIPLLVSFDFGDSGSLPSEFTAVSAISLDFSSSPWGLGDSRGLTQFSANGASNPTIVSAQVQAAVPTWSGGQPLSGAQMQMLDLDITDVRVQAQLPAVDGVAAVLHVGCQTNASPAQGGDRYVELVFQRASGQRTLYVIENLDGTPVVSATTTEPAGIASQIYLRVRAVNDLYEYAWSTDASTWNVIKTSTQSWPIPRVKKSGPIQFYATSTGSGLPSGAQTVIFDNFSWTGTGRLTFGVYHGRMHSAMRMVTVKNILPSGIASTAAFGTASLTYGKNLNPTGIASTGARGTPTVITIGRIMPVGIASTAVVGRPMVPKFVVPSGRPSTAVIGQPTVIATSPAPPPQARAEILWRIILCDALGAPIEDLTPYTYDRKISYRLNRPSVMTFRVPSDARLVNELAPDGKPNLMTIRRVIKGYRAEVQGGQEYYNLRFIGLIWQIEDSGDLDSAWTNVVVFGAFQILSKRLCVNAAGSESAASFTNVDGGLIVSTMLTKLNSLSYSGIDMGTRDTTAARTADFSYLDMASAMAQLTGAYQGFDIEMVPLDRRDGHLQTLNIKGRKGAYRPNAIFAWGLPPHNVNTINRLNDAEQYANSVLLLGAPPPVDGALPITSSQTAASPAEARVFRIMESYPDITNTAYLTALAQEELTFRQLAREMISFTPQPGRAPEPFTDYDTGDTVPIYVGSRLRGGFQGVVRIYGFDLELTNESEERVTALLLSPES